MSTNLALVGEVPLFALLDQNERATLAELIEVESYAAGQTVFSIGDVGGSLYVLHRGRVQVTTESADMECIVLGEYHPGEVFGEISLLDGGPRNANATAVEDSELLVITRDKLYELIRQHPHAALDILTAVGARLRRTDELLRTHVARNANVEEQERLTFGERVADRMAAFGGSWTFIILFALMMSGWIALNVVWLARKPFDPYPFILLNLVLSMLAAIQAPVIMMSQNRQAAKDRLKTDLDYQVNLKAELEVASLQRKVDRLYEVLQQHWDVELREKKRQRDVQEGTKANDYY